MPIQSTDTTATINFASSSTSWLIKAGVGVVPNTGVGVSCAFTSCVLTNHGDIESGGAEGVVFSASNGRILNAADGTISGTIGMSLLGATDFALNQGTVVGDTAGVRLWGNGSTLDNSGYVRANQNGVDVSTGATLHNHGDIAGGQKGVYVHLDDYNSVSIQNDGTISGEIGSITVYSPNGAVGSIDNSGLLEGEVNLFSLTTGFTVNNSGLIKGAVGFGSGADTYNGRGGSVEGVVLGNSGSDTLVGGSDDDVLNGGAGVDKLDGGKGGEDTFIFSAVADSTAKNPDVITKHWTASDTIDVSALDANATVSGNQDFTFGGSVAPGATLVTGVIDYVQQNGNTYVVADTSGDGKADFEVVIHGTFTLNSGEFVL